MAELTTLYLSVPPVGVIRGATRLIDVPSPAAGAEFTFTIPAEGSWHIESIRYVFTTSAAVANRESTLSITDGSVERLRLPTGFTQAASVGETYTWVEVGQSQSGAQAAARVSCLPAGLIYPTGWVFSTITTAIQAGDQYSGIRLWVAELPEGPTGYPQGPGYLDDPIEVRGGY